MTDEAKLDLIAEAICNTGVFENGQGVCALRCMDQLGPVRPNCIHAHEIFRKHAEAVLQVSSKKQGPPSKSVKVVRCKICGLTHVPNSWSCPGAF